MAWLRLGLAEAETENPHRLMKSIENIYFLHTEFIIVFGSSSQTININSSADPAKQQSIVLKHLQE